MAAKQQFSVTLPPDMAEVVEEKLRRGEYDSASALMSEGVQALLDRDASLETWLRDVVVPGHAEYLADPSRAVPAEELLARIKARRAAGR
ncbi:CopG family transcriptional regulator [Methylosinus sp. R-45379]|jgi:Arc/MetJ-type ribon-helix-helix transcriptional regulator|uniref:ribbon-helix-helix domain-containing protein n=1 Tax=unclassified Methylosinus TaxID=2624500 RepID=UPI000466A4D1|nr:MULTISPECIES: type II toxin-antitoxin system ParD family antitoxin [unclassified Methylosinus]OAI24321.1 CopG family transcriptional regulator [Methylosinus sp. R-45379]TDX60569.1 Arc/MetJ-type ribon-helix-helix transcriptional regulator [Methylosinus sp. sav-2]